MFSLIHLWEKPGICTQFRTKFLSLLYFSDIKSKSSIYMKTRLNIKEVVSLSFRETNKDFVLLLVSIFICISF